MMLIVLLLLSSGTVLHGEDRVIVQTQDGKVRGETLRSDLGKEVDVWDRIPFAQPPVGELRFQHPRPIKPWTGVKNVTGKPNSCIQISGISFPGHPGEKVWVYNTPISEDCLYLSITKPAGAHNKNLPVMVWIYGGSFYSGTSTLELYDPKILASERNVIVVSIQYRVASLGFLFLDTKDVPGNAGLMDQVMALTWIKNNIRGFGGDTGSITLFSESAGSASVGFHLVSPLSANLFHRAILQSATGLNPWGLITKAEARRRALLLAEKMDCPSDTKYITNIISCLRAANSTALVNYEHDNIVFGICSFPFVPIVDGLFLPASPAKLLGSGAFPRREILLGANQDEGSYFLIYYLTEIFKLSDNITVSRDEFDNAVSELNLYVKPIGLSAIKFQYTDWMDPENSRSRARSLDRMVGDFQFTCPVLHFAEIFAAREPSINVYVYHFRHRTVNSPWPIWSGVMHGDEIAFVFGDPFRKIGAVNYTEKERRLSTDIMIYWSNFAVTGNPNRYGNGSWVPQLGGVYWPIHSHSSREYLEIQTTRHINKTGLKTAECEFWKSFLPQLLKSAEEPQIENKFDKCRKCRCGSTDKSGSSSCTTHTSLIVSTLLLSLLSTVLVGTIL